MTVKEKVDSKKKEVKKEKTKHAPKPDEKLVGQSMAKKFLKMKGK